MHIGATRKTPLGPPHPIRLFATLSAPCATRFKTLPNPAKTLPNPAQTLHFWSNMPFFDLRCMGLTCMMAVSCPEMSASGQCLSGRNTPNGLQNASELGQICNQRANTRSKPCQNLRRRCFLARSSQSSVCLLGWHAVSCAEQTTPKLKAPRKARRPWVNRCPS